MALDWKVRVDRRLMESDVEAWTTGMLWNEASSTAAPPSRPPLAGLPHTGLALCVLASMPVQGSAHSARPAIFCGGSVVATLIRQQSLVKLAHACNSGANVIAKQFRSL